MNRIAIRRFAPESVSTLEQMYSDVLKCLHDVVPPSVSELYATPHVADSGFVSWYSPVAGQPTPLEDLAVVQAEQLSKAIFERLASIRQVANRLATKPGHDPRLVQLLINASGAPPVEAVYSLNGRPVILFWNNAIFSGGRRATLNMPRGAPPAGQAVANVLVPDVLFHRFWKWLLLAFLLLLIIFFAGGHYLRKRIADRTDGGMLSSIDIQHNKNTDTASLAQPASTDIQPNKNTDTALLPQPTNIDLEPNKTTDTASLPQPTSESKQATTLAETPNPKPISITTAKEYCAGERPPELAPEIALVFDSSRSMQLNINTTAAVERLVGEVARAGPSGLIKFSSAQLKQLQNVFSEPSRLSVAKRQTIALIDRLPKDVIASLVVLEDCPSAKPVGRFLPAERGSLSKKLNALLPTNGTPLADGILKASQLVDGVHREATILVISDGGESCGGDPCQMARQLAQTHPYLKINVVDIGGVGGASCLAANTGGRVFSAETIDQVVAGLGSAATDVLGPQDCK